jgi:hypothetical protein
MSPAPLPPVHAPYAGGDPTEALGDLRQIIEHAITHQPRSQQRTIGPSEIGTPCDHCLAAKLAGWARTDDGVPWLPYIGTAVHAQLEEALLQHENARNAVHTTGARYLTEARVMVGHIGGREIWGSTDLVDLTVGMTVDWKCVGASTLRKAKAGPSQTYRVQAHLYARGWNLAGHRVDHVAIAYLPRNDMGGLNAAVWWHEPYDEQVAIDALDRANRIHANLTALDALGTEARDRWVTALPRAEGCFDCPKYPDGADLPAPGHRPAEAAFADLLG